jgi:PEP-CTERM motif
MRSPRPDASFDQTVGGELDFLLSSTTSPTTYQLTITGTASLADGLGIDLASGFGLISGDSFDLLTTSPLGALSGGFDSLSLDSAACSALATDVWRCGGFYFALDVMTGASGYVDLSVASVPEPSAWALLGAGFLGLGALAMRRRFWPLAA